MPLNDPVKTAKYLIDLLERPATGKTHAMIHGLPKNYVLICADRDEIQSISPFVRLNQHVTTISGVGVGGNCCLVRAYVNRPPILTHLAVQNLLASLLDKISTLETSIEHARANHMRTLQTALTRASSESNRPTEIELVRCDMQQATHFQVEDEHGMSSIKSIEQLGDLQNLRGNFTVTYYTNAVQDTSHTGISARRKLGRSSLIRCDSALATHFRIVVKGQGWTPPLPIEEYDGDSDGQAIEFYMPYLDVKTQDDIAPAPAESVDCMSCRYDREGDELHCLKCENNSNWTPMK